jgi:polyferredoxin
VDILRLPVVGALLRWRHVRLAFQLVLLALAIGIVLHGFFGPQIAPRNLSTVLTSIHWRGLLVLALVAVGNLFCGACPMVLVRDAGRRLVPPRFSFPRRLRRKWLGLLLLVLVLFSYELFDVWERPAATAWIVLAYFGLALVVDLLFKGASFCKHICPIGQFNFIAATMSPAELHVRDTERCHSCRTFDCIKGRKTAAEGMPVRITRRGCELGLFLPGKIGNLDCTLCLDCVHACPHDNIALVTRVPGVELLETARRSGIGRLTDRLDVAALAVVFTFAALVNAFAMTAPAVTAERWLAGVMHVSSEAAVLAALFAISIVAAPAVLLGGAAMATRAVTGESRTPLRSTMVRYAFALVPFGFGVWLAHYGFHLLTGILTVVPVIQSTAIDLFGSPALGDPAWRWTGLAPGSVYAIQLGFILLGAFGSIGLVRATSVRDYPTRMALASAPWFTAILLLAAVALWILAQPMEMRGLGGVG